MLTAATGAWGAYRLHVRSIRRQFAAVLDERNRLAREMHDTLIQGCVGVSTLLEAASHAQEISPTLGGELLDRARSEVRAAVDEARLAVWNLRRGSPNGDRLVPAVSQLAHRISLESGIDIRVHVEAEPVALGSDTEGSLLMLIREALQNAIRHAAPRRLSVTLGFDRKRLRVEIEDDGLGFDSGGRSRELAALRPRRHARARRTVGRRIPTDELAWKGHACTPQHPVAQVVILPPLDGATWIPVR